MKKCTALRFMEAMFQAEGAGAVETMRKEGELRMFKE